MRVLLPLCFLLVATSQLPDTRRSPRERAVDWIPPGIFDPSLPPCSKLRRTRGSLCAISEHASYWIDEGDSAYAEEMSREEPGSTLIDATSWERGSAELWRAGDGILLVAADLGDGWRPRPIPHEMQPKDPRAEMPMAWAIAGCGEVLVVCRGDSILRHAGGRWTRVPLALRGDGTRARFDRALLVGSELFLIVQHWPASELIVADIDTGRARVENDSFPEGANYVRDVDLGPDGRVYVTCGAPVMSTGGQVLVRDGDVWSALLSSPVRAMELVCGNAPPPRHPRSGEPSHSFLALAFDGEKRPCVLTDDTGIFRRDAEGTWSCITPGWNSGAGACDLEISGHVAHIASSSVGVLTLDLDTLKGERLRTR